ncbi:MAG: serine hydrolase [Flavobacteriaceae bacterium]
MVFLIGCNPSKPLERVFESASPEFQEMLSDPKHEIQIRYTQITRDSVGFPLFNTMSYSENSDAYFYPASTAKLPIAALALQRINELKAQGVAIDLHTPFEIYTDRFNTPIALQDSTKADRHLTVAHLIKKIFLVSDNDAYNYLFDFLGKDYINASLKEKGLNHTEIQHKFLFGADNTYTWNYVFLRNGDTVYKQPSITSELEVLNTATIGVMKGLGFQSNDSIVNEPFDFRLKNRIALEDLEGIMKRLVFPEVFSESERFNLTEEDYAFMRYWMSRNTLESDEPNYKNDEEHYYSYVKFFIYGDRKGEMTDAIRIHNKVGLAYGTLTDVAYITDRESGVEFLLSATILVNENQIFNDNQYEYEEKGIPFLAELGRLILRAAQQRH